LWDEGNTRRDHTRCKRQHRDAEQLGRYRHPVITGLRLQLPRLPAILCNEVRCFAKRSRTSKLPETKRFSSFLACSVGCLRSRRLLVRIHSGILATEARRAVARNKGEGGRFLRFVNYRLRSVAGSNPFGADTPPFLADISAWPAVSAGRSSLNLTVENTVFSMNSAPKDSSQA
jgi:hypothetical protein